MSSIPKNFFPLLTTFSDFSRKKIKLNLVGKDECQAGDLIQVLLPEGKLLMDTFALGGLVSTTTNADYAIVPPVSQLIEQVMVEVN